MGFMEAGFEVIAGCDNDPHAALTYMYNLGAYPIDIHYVEPADNDRLNKAAEESMLDHQGMLRIVKRSGGGWLVSHSDIPGVSHFFFGDVTKLTGDLMLRAIGMERGELDCVMGGPPCQGFSYAGKRNVMDPRNSLIFEFARLIVELAPKTFVMENVPGIVSMVTPEGPPVLDVFCQLLEDGGYGSYDALRRALAGQTEAKAGLKGPSKARPVAQPKIDRDAIRAAAKAVRLQGATGEATQAALF